MNLRLAIVGCGKIARDQHLPAIARQPEISLVAVADPVAGVDGVAHFPDLAALLEAKIALDAVSICTPPQGRRAIAQAALTAGLHVLLEKPPGATVSEIAPLLSLARSNGKTLFATWHSRFAAAVAPARAFLTDRRIDSVTIEWKEDVRQWHPGQQWIWEPGGLGVFDPGINALSILTEILPRPVFLTGSVLTFPANRAAPIAAELSFSDTLRTPIAAVFDWRQLGPQIWHMHFDTDAGRLTLGDGGKTLRHDGRLLVQAGDVEYDAMYRHLLRLVADRRCDVDLSPLVLVADAFLFGRRQDTEAFEDRSK